MLEWQRATKRLRSRAACWACEASSAHAAKLLADEELCAAEDLCADFVEIQASVPHVLTEDAIFRGVGRSFEPAVRLHKLVRLSSKMASDAAFARQLKRKFL